LKESSDGETLIAVGMWFQIWGEAEEKAQTTSQFLHKQLRILQYSLQNEVQDSCCKFQEAAELWSNEIQHTYSLMCSDFYNKSSQVKSSQVAF